MPAEFDFNILNVVSNGGAMSILAYLAIYLIPRWMEKTGSAFSELLKTFKAEQQFEREMCTTQFDRIMTTMDQDQKVLEKHLDMMQQQMNGYQKLLEGVVEKLSKVK